MTLIAGSAFAADGANGKFKRRGNNAQLNTGTFQIVVPKADRGGSGRQVAKFVAPKADRGNSSGPKTLFSISPKAPRADSGSTIAQSVAPKAPRGDGPVVATAEQPKFAAPQLLAPASATNVCQGRAGDSCSGSR